MEAKVEMFFQGKEILVGTHILFLPISFFPKKGKFYSKMPFLNPRPPHPKKKKSFKLKCKTAYIAGYLCFTYIGVHIYKD